MGSNILSTVIYYLLYLYVKDKNLKSKNDFEKRKKMIFDSLINFIKSDKNFIALPDKEVFVEKILDDFANIAYKDDKLSESAFLEYINNLLLDINNEDKQKCFDLLIKFASLDKVVTNKELEVIYQIANQMKIDVDDINVYVKNKFKEFKKEKNIDKIKFGKAPIVFAIISILLLVGAGYLFYNTTNYKKKMLLKNAKMSNIVYKKIYFNKYIVAGNAYAGDVEGQSETMQKWFGKAVVFYAEGEAGIEFNLKDFKLIDDKLVYSGVYPDGADEVYPILVDVNISNKNFKRVYEKKPHEIEKSEAANFAKVVGIATAVVGGYIGAKVGKTVGGFIPIGGNPLLGKLAGLASGGVLGSLTGGVGGYIATKKILTGVQLTKDITAADEEKIFNAAKKVIAAEIYSNEELMTQLKADFEKYVKSYFKRFEVDIKEIIYDKRGSLS